MSRSYLGDHPEIYKKIITTPQRIIKNNEPIDLEAMTEQFISQEKQRIYDLQMRIKAYQIKIKEQSNINLDYSDPISELQSQIKACRAQEAQILQQIQNCRKVENQVAPMEYYLWKKKQRINTFDVSIAQLFQEVQQQRAYLQRSIEEFRQESQEVQGQIYQLEDRIANFNTSQRQSIIPAELEEEQFNQLFSKNAMLSEQYNSLRAIFIGEQQNRDIVRKQIVDNIETLMGNLKSYFEQQKASLAREFKQLQANQRNTSLAPLTVQQHQQLNIDSQLAEYSQRISEIYNSVPKEIRNKIQPILQPLPWKNININQYLQIDSRVEAICNENTNLQRQLTRQIDEIKQIQQKIKNTSLLLAKEQHQYDQKQIDIKKLKKKIGK